MNKTNSVLYVRIFAILIILLALGVYLYMTYGPQGIVPAQEPLKINLVPKFKSIAYDYNSHAGFYTNAQNPFYFYTKDGISYRSSSGETLWDDVFDMTAPTASGSGNYIGIAEMKGTQFRVYGPSGRSYLKNFDYPIVGFSINELGYSSVQLQTPSGYATHTFDGAGEAIESRNDVEYNLFPVMSCLSPNGQRIAISFLSINSVLMESHLVFAQLSGTEWGGVKKSDQIIGSARFLGNSNLIMASDLELAAFSMTDSNTLIDGNAIPLSNEIKFLGYMGDKGIVIVLGRGLPGKEAEQENTVRFYNEKLELTGEFDVPNNVTYLSADAMGAIVAAGQTFYALGPKANLLWTYNSPKEVKQMLFLGNTDTVIEAGTTEARILKRERLKEAAQSAAEPDAPAEPDTPAEPAEGLPADDTAETEGME